MSERSESNPLRAFVRGAWILLLVQLVVALLVFGAITYGSLQLSSILDQTAVKHRELQDLQTERTSLQQSIGELRQGVQNAHDATPIVRSAIISFHNRRYADAVDQYQEALRLDPANTYVRDLMSYSQYMAGRTALSAGQLETSARRFEDAVDSVRQVLREVPNYIGGYVELAIYECARNQSDAALAAYDAALARSQDAKDAFASRLGEIPQRCAALRGRLAAQ
jgi:cytochrome c-type biogenesis protein CcmH/NrfG